MTGDDWKVSKCLFEYAGKILKTSLVIVKVNRILFKNFVLVDKQGGSRLLPLCDHIEDLVLIACCLLLEDVGRQKGSGRVL